MTTLREAAQQAILTLDASLGFVPTGYGIERACWIALNQLRTALEAEPVTNQCGETCERAKLCAICAGPIAYEVDDSIRDLRQFLKPPLCYVNTTTLDMAIGFWNSEIPELYEAVYPETYVIELLRERNNAEKREYAMLGRANALEAELKATKAEAGRACLLMMKLT